MLPRCYEQLAFGIVTETRGAEVTRRRGIPAPPPTRAPLSGDPCTGARRRVRALGFKLERSDAQVRCQTTGVKSLVPDREDEFGVSHSHGAGEVYGICPSKSVHSG